MLNELVAQYKVSKFMFWVTSNVPIGLSLQSKKVKAMFWLTSRVVKLLLLQYKAVKAVKASIPVKSEIDQ